MLKICVEGWRGINHSFSIVNQNQLLELLKLPVNLKIRDIPYFDKNWSLKNNPDGFLVSEKKIKRLQNQLILEKAENENLRNRMRQLKNENIRIQSELSRNQLEMSNKVRGLTNENQHLQSSLDSA